MQATGRMAGQAGPSVFQAIAALLVATALVVGLALGAQRLSVGGAAAPAAAPAADAVQAALNAHRIGEKGALVATPGGTWTSGDLSRSLQDVRQPTRYVPFDAGAFRLDEKQPLATTPKNVVQIIPGEYRPIATPEKPDAIRRGSIAHR
jgi:hypothetical protein